MATSPSLPPKHSAPFSTARLFRPPLPSVTSNSMLLLSTIVCMLKKWQISRNFDSSSLNSSGQSLMVMGQSLQTVEDLRPLPSPELASHLYWDPMSNLKNWTLIQVASRFLSFPAPI